MDAVSLYVLVRVPTKQAVYRAIEIAGSQQKLANHFGVTKQAIFKWIKGGVPKRMWKDLLNYCKENQ